MANSKTPTRGKDGVIEKKLYETSYELKEELMRAIAASVGNDGIFPPREDDDEDDTAGDGEKGGAA